MNKKGLSEVVTTVLIILLVLAAVIIIWTYVKPTIENNIKKVNTVECYSMDLAATNCVKTATGVNVTVSRKSADMSIQSLVFNSETITGDKVIDEVPTGIPAVLETKTFPIARLNVTKVAATARIKTQDGSIILCDPVSTPVVCS